MGFQHLTAITLRSHLFHKCVVCVDIIRYLSLCVYGKRTYGFLRYVHNPELTLPHLLVRRETISAKALFDILWFNRCCIRKAFSLISTLIISINILWS
ncbi:hypothetical protein XELAEV_18026049mg [Xenopus laevis]|uniref:Uncharacterized protein n=1 Tax=Xenopus laevis TaxID=8355 RepID=A0A974CTC7_XENLA|nr:hypothetical protein XELAEV_18026049mg [Xenopus laevis]